MASREIELPEKLTRDAILEAILEVRFDMTTLPEVLFGRLVSYEPWKNLKQKRMPAYNVPAPLRDADEDLRFQPIFELTANDSKRSIRIGPHVLSFHIMAPYIGWKLFEAELRETVQQLFSSSEDLVVRRLGLRYINALTPGHGISSLADLDLSIKIAQEPLLGKTNLNFTTELPSNTLCTVRVATPDFVTGPLPTDTALLIDVDVYTKEGFKTKGIKEVLAWIGFAHDKEKVEFFHLLPDTVIEALKEA